MMRRMVTIAVIAIVLAGLGAGVCAFADTYTFNFNALASGAPASGGTGNYSSIQNYMNWVLGCSIKAPCVTVTGAVADQTYSGDGHVVGPKVGSSYKSLTLGYSEGATNSNGTLNSSPDTFIANTSDKSTQVSNEISIKFTGVTISGLVSFDYEIFPDGSCTQLSSSNCGGKAKNGIYPNQPDLEFEAGNNSNGTDPYVTSFGTGGIQYGVAPGTTNGSAKHSWSSGSKTEYSPQYIGTWSGSLNSVTELDFIDWPATIGIDNLVITTYKPPTGVPEPGTIMLLGTGMVGLTGWVRQKKSKKR